MHLYHIEVKSEYQGHCVKVKLTRKSSCTKASGILPTSYQGPLCCSVSRWGRGIYPHPMQTGVPPYSPNMGYSHPISIGVPPSSPDGYIPIQSQWVVFPPVLKGVLPSSHGGSYLIQS